MNIREILLEVLKEACEGSIKIDDLEYNINFNTFISHEPLLINDNNSFSINISNLDLLVEKIKEYLLLETKLDRKKYSFLSEKDSIKLLILYLFINASTKDLNDINQYVEKYISFLKDNLFEEEILLRNSNLFEEDILKINRVKQSVFMETPYKIEMSLMDKNNFDKEFVLPEISYAITEENGEKICYVYSIMNKNKETKDETAEQIKYKRRISRLLYKLDKGIFDIETEEFREYKEGESDYYPENVSDVSVSAVLSLYIFINLIKNHVSKIKAVPYLPMRYLSRENANEKFKDIDKKEELETRNNDIQRNATDKFIRTFRRVSLYIPEMTIDSYPYEYDEFLNCSLTECNKEAISNEITDSIPNRI